MQHRLIPSLVVQDSGAFYTRAHQTVKYVGDATNIVKLLSDYGVDEIAIVVKDSRSLPLLEKIAKYSQRPLSISGLGNKLEYIQRLLEAGFDRIGVTIDRTDVDTLEMLVARFGRSSLIGNFNFYSIPDPKIISTKLEALAADCFSEVIIHDVSRSGSQKGFSETLVRALNDAWRKKRVRLSIEGGFDGLLPALEYSAGVYYSAKYIFKSDSEALTNIMINPVLTT